MSNKIIKNIRPLGMHWETRDPFLFCAHHLDYYPGGNDELGPNVSIAGRTIGQDFAGKDGWNMYHGRKTPGFPSHPHRGFETVSIVKQGFIDHSDSIGGSGRFAKGDVQWLTSGKGVQHAEMFPLVESDKNPMEMFQIWINLPKKNKFVDPHYKMLWQEDIPVVTVKDSNGKTSIIDVIAGQFEEKKALDPTPNSWAADSENDVQIWTIKMTPGAKLSIPKSADGLNRSIYFYSGDTIEIEGKSILGGHGVDVLSNAELSIVNGKTESHILFLQGKPINEPVAQYGPFVMNTQAEIQQAITEYQQTQFGGWPWANNEPVHDNAGRFAKYSDGKQEKR